MAKTKTVYVCQSCGAKSPKWIGRCSSCGEWNTYIEEIEISKQSKSRDIDSVRSMKSSPQRISEIDLKDEPRILTPDIEFNRVVGGGLVPGSITLIGGEPGIGKSTLVLQLALLLSEKKILYVSGEESNRQIKLRAERIGTISDNCYIHSETLLENVLLFLEKMQPDLVILDSIQTLRTERLESAAGSVSQIRECTGAIMQFAKQNATPILLIGHITKEGSLAGPKVLEHIVDTVLHFEGDRHHIYRILRTTKNRFGSTSELGIYEMRSDGLREVSNPSEMLLSQSDESLSGVAVAAGIEGIRPFLIEIQALVSSAAYGTPQRSSTGFDLRRLGMLLAVLEKRAGFRLAVKDVFLNIAGGIKIDDPASDLAVICAILSSDQDLPIPKQVCFAGEVGLTGEIRPVHRIEQRIAEAEKLGFEKIFISKYNQKGIDFSSFRISVHFVAKVEEVFQALFG